MVSPEGSGVGSKTGFIVLRLVNSMKREAVRKGF
jgi:hypothetical protein